jgi:hypothetical protein
MGANRRRAPSIVAIGGDGLPTFYNVDNDVTRGSIEVAYKYVRKWNIHKQYAGTGHPYPVNGEEVYVVYEPVGPGWREVPAQGLISVRAATSVFDALLRLVPDRIAREEVGDSLDDVYRRSLTGWRLWLKVASTVFITLFNVAREAVSRWRR